ncbi:MAG TPA: hypothetical protein VJ724_05750 [Tahibacter sp.]|nr:hypothetical protein [Tahibacter sp.]
MTAAFRWRHDDDTGAIELVDTPARDRDSAPEYRHVADFSGHARASCAHGLVVDGEPVALFLGGSGASGVHAHSAVVVRGFVYIAVGNRVACVRPRPYALVWSTVVDVATCFGVHHDAAHDALISHGELEIARVDDAGGIVWSTPGRDIFTGAIALHGDCIEAIDFAGTAHRFDYASGFPARNF